MNNEKQNLKEKKESESFIETLRAIYQAQWQDIHHSREQDWRLSQILIFGFLGVGGLKIIGQFPELQRIASFIFAIISFLAVAITLRHQSLFNEKMKAIKKLEELLNVPKLFERRKGWDKIFTVQILLVILYMIFALFFLYLGFSEIMVDSIEVPIEIQ